MPLTDARLTAIMEMLPKCRVTADIGADHGRLGAQLLLSRVSENVWFSDISADSLQKARVLIGRLNLNSRAGFFVGDGAMALPGAPDAAVIAGMGGSTIAGIIRAAGEKFQNTYLVLEPNVGLTELRSTLEAEGYAICEERLVRAAQRFYVLMGAQKGSMHLTEEERLIGPKLMERRD